MLAIAFHPDQRCRLSPFSRFGPLVLGELRNVPLVFTLLAMVAGCSIVSFCFCEAAVSSLSRCLLHLFRYGMHFFLFVISFGFFSIASWARIKSFSLVCAVQLHPSMPLRADNVCLSLGVDSAAA
jgi:hypothetical protein